MLLKKVSAFPLQNAPLNLGPGNFGCPYCEKIKDSKHAMESHIRTHTDERPYECPICHKKFTQSGTRNRHLQSLHKNSISEGDAAGAAAGAKSFNLYLEKMGK